MLIQMITVMIKSKAVMMQMICSTDDTNERNKTDANSDDSYASSYDTAENTDDSCDDTSESCDDKDDSCDCDDTGGTLL